MAAADPAPAASGGSLAPLRGRAFAVLWAAAVAGNIGSFMRDVASAWVVTELTAQPAAVALVQAAATLPIFLLAIPAGVMSDLLDRRRFLIAVQVLLAAVSATLMLLSATGLLGVPTLVLLSFAGGVGAALMAPTWQAVVPELVSRPQLRNAVALNSLGINIARAIGPAMGGLLLAWLGARWTYGFTLLNYALVIAALRWWRRPAPAPDPLAEQFFGALRAGWRFARSSHELQRVMLRAIGFFTCASAVWALLPLVARGLLGGNATFYGLLLGAVGLGAIGGALLLPRLRGHLGPDGLLLASALLCAATSAALALAPPKPLALLLTALLGLGWIIALTTLNGVAQAILPNWVRGRGLAVYLMVFNGAMTAGSLAWGAVAEALGVPTTLLVAAAGLALLGLLAHRAPLPAGEHDLQPVHPWPEPPGAAVHSAGPVLIQIEYRVREADRPAFVAALQRLASVRRRDGAHAWGLTEDTEAPEQLVEWFLVESWAEHLRQHRRAAQPDADLHQAVLRWHQGDTPPKVRHLLTVKT